MYAYVNYLSDGQKEIVPRKFILNLDENEVDAVDPKVIYKIFWTSETEEDARLERFEKFMKKAQFDNTFFNVVDFKRTAAKKRGKVCPPDGFYEGNVLLLKGTIESIEEIVDKISPKRLRNPTSKVLQEKKMKPSSTIKRGKNPKTIKKKLQNAASRSAIESLLDLKKKDDLVEADETPDGKECDDADKNRKKNEKTDGNENLKKENKICDNSNVREEKNQKIENDQENEGETKLTNMYDEGSKDDETKNSSPEALQKEVKKSLNSEPEESSSKDDETKNSSPEALQKEVKKSLNSEPEESSEPSGASSSEDFTSEDSDDDIVPNPIHKKLQEKYKITKEKNLELEKKLKNLENDYNDLRAKFEKQKKQFQEDVNDKNNWLKNKKDLETELAKMKEENKGLKRKVNNYQELNLNLQNQLLHDAKRLRTEKSENKPESSKTEEFKLHFEEFKLDFDDSNDSALKEPKTTPNSDHEKKDNGFQMGGDISTEFPDVEISSINSANNIDTSEIVDIYGFPVEKEKHELIREKKYNDSKYCGSLAELMWQETLLERSVRGQKPKKKDSAPKKPLTPKKVQAIRSALKDKINEQEPNLLKIDPEQFAVRTSTEKVEQHIKTKIYNLKKKKQE